MAQIATAIWVGRRILGKIGELVANLDQNPLPNGKQRRKVLLQATGVVIEADGLGKRKVRFDHNNKVASIATTALRVIDAAAGLPLVRISC